jgi:hypothetical protein
MDEPEPTPAALTVGQMSRLLDVPEDKISGHLEDGAPTNPDGTINMVFYAAWLCRRLKEHSGS